jgi:hypothetical protein
MMRLGPLPALLALLAASSAFANERYSYAGWFRTTTPSEAQSRYPNSVLAESRMYVADLDSQDDIHGALFEPGAVALLFQKALGAGKHLYPSCSTVLGRVRKLHGDFAEMQSSNDEPLFVQTYTWRQDQERLGIRCFKQDGRWFAERLNLYAVTP